MTDGTHRILIGYWPLIHYSDFVKTPGEQIELGEENGIKEILEKLYAIDTPQIQGVLWAHHPFEDAESPEDNDVIPIFIIDRANEIVDHLEQWMENDNDRFSLHFEGRDNGYAIVLFPNPLKSVDRWKQARLTYHEEFVMDKEFTVLFQTLGVCCPNGKTYELIKDKLKSPVRLGFIDSKDVSLENPPGPGTPMGADVNKIRVAGPFQMFVGDEQVKEHFDRLFEDAVDQS